MRALLDINVIIALLDPTVAARGYDIRLPRRRYSNASQKRSAQFEPL